MNELDYQLKVQKETVKKLNEISRKRKGPTKEKLKEIIKTERNVFLNAIIDLYNQRTDVERSERRLQEQLDELQNENNNLCNDIVDLNLTIENKEKQLNEANDTLIKSQNMKQPDRNNFVAQYLLKWGVK